MPRHHSSGFRMVASTAITRDISVAPPRAKGVRFRDIDCIDCAAKAGEYCINIYGRRLTQGHISRVRRAARKAQDAS